MMIGRRKLEAELETERLTLNLPELAKKLGISRGSCYSLAQQGKLPVPIIKLGRRMVVSKKSVEEILSGRQGEKAD